MRQTVLIVDDHEAFRESAAALLEAEGFDVVGQAADGPKAVAEVERLQPEVVLLDIQLPELDGFAVAERMAALPDPPRVVLISSRQAQRVRPHVSAQRLRGVHHEARALGRGARRTRGLHGASAPALAVAGRRGGRNRRGVGLLRLGRLGRLAT